MSGSAEWNKIESALEAHKRLAWFPIVEEVSATPFSSKFSGIPALPAGDSWPCCSNCHAPMQLFLQLNSKELPVSAKDAFGEGLLQVFYCTNREQECEVECEAFFPFAKSTLVRVIDSASETLFCPDNSPVHDAFPERSISSWESKEDYPDCVELRTMGVALTDSQCEMLCDLEYPLPKDKLLGWPHWVQGIEYPDCPDCGKSMRLVFQIDSEDNLPYMFGDVGCSHITMCEDHPERLAIAWACG